ncbi:MAG: succinate dehydrogenase, cytochrome b556 subunit [Acetobacteraceae bacterium]|nr:succinate dehydrogenase, cytochrome b556 subunit [Acetobacteraceae bacterium]
MDSRDALMVGTTSDGKPMARPLSPHLQVYRPQITTVMSIMHRITGVGLGLGALVLACWLVAAAGSAELFARVQWFLGSWLGVLLLLGWTAALAFHFCNGIRHLWWDTCRGFSIRQVNESGMIALAAAAVLTVLVVLAAILA